MFESLLGFWSGKDFLAQVLDDFAEMLNTAESMYADVVEHFAKPKPDGDFKQSIYERDRSINTLERKIRRRIIEHLAVRPRVSLNVCLILMSVVKDAERVGDYTKNLLDVAEVLRRPVDADAAKRFETEIPHEISKSFADTAKAFIDSDETLARAVVRRQRDVAARCEKIWRDMATSELPPNQAVCLAIAARYHKRIALHLANIATAVIMPVTDLDYWDEDAGPGQELANPEDTHPGYEMS